MVATALDYLTMIRAMPSGVVSTFDWHRDDLAARLQPADERKDAVRRLPAADDADGHGDLQRPHANHLDRKSHALALIASEVIDDRVGQRP